MIQLGLIGYPLGHSLSPKIHKAALAACDIEGNYSLLPIHPEDSKGLRDLLNQLRKGEMQGINVTIPYKQTIISLLDDLTPTAEAIGAVNTIFNREGNLLGENTDAAGFWADVSSIISSVKADHKIAVILGAGGAASAVAYALIQDGWSVTVAARRIEQAIKLSDRLSITPANFDFVNKYEVSLVINATPIGMHPDVNYSPWPKDRPFPSEAVIYDLVYNPRETKLVKDARAFGLLAESGLGMLVEQAARSFEIWTGCSPPRIKLFESVADEANALAARDRSNSKRR